MKFGTTRHKFGTTRQRGIPHVRKFGGKGLYICLCRHISENAENARNGYSKKGRKTPFFRIVLSFSPTIDGGNMNIRTYTKTYALFRDICEDEQERIKDSSECRKFVLKNIRSADYQTLIKKMANCIYDLTGDSLFRDQIYQELERRQK